MRRIFITCLIILTACTIAYSQPEAAKIVSAISNSGIQAVKDTLNDFKSVYIYGLEIPAKKQEENSISHIAYSFSFNNVYKQANWVAYKLTSENTKPVVKRKNKFSTDPLVKEGTATDEDYKDSGYDRGHLAPAGDMGWSAITMTESFYYSNISPQNKSFNRGIWKRLEEQVRIWAVEYDSVYIVTGPVLTGCLTTTIGKNKVAVPDYFYKVILVYTYPDIKGIGFIVPNSVSSEVLQKFAVTIDSVETVTGIDFFPLLPDEQEKMVECNLKLESWIWREMKSDKKNIISLPVQEQ